MRKVLHRLIKAALTELNGLDFDGGTTFSYSCAVYGRRKNLFLICSLLQYTVLCCTVL